MSSALLCFALLAAQTFLLDQILHWCRRLCSHKLSRRLNLAADRHLPDTVEPIADVAAA